MKSLRLPIITGLLAGVLAAGSAFALDLEISGEVKTGLYYETREQGGETYTYARIYNNDGDSGKAEGRIRLGMNLIAESFGIRTRFFQESFLRGTALNDASVEKVLVDFAYAYVNLLDNQFTVSAGLTGESPWGTGGPELYREVEYNDGGYPVMGIRTEWKPNFLPGLNLGFVLNRQDDTVPSDAVQKFGDLFLESVVGIAYEHDYFAFRFAYRFDRGIDSPAAIVNGDRFVYRVEERILGKLLPGMAIWANGYCYGIGAEGKGSGRAAPGYIQNWFYASYDPEYFNTGVNVGYLDIFGNQSNFQQLEIKPYFYWKFFDNLLVVGAMGGMIIGFNNAKGFEDSFYNTWFIEPQVRVNINSGFYTALVYRFSSSPENLSGNKDTTHWLNIRLVYTF
jgi:hypothetical protein